ncbi:MAG: GC-type dockerin domain-anchored protein [Planctomycetota bacterium]
MDNQHVATLCRCVLRRCAPAVVSFLLVIGAAGVPAKAETAERVQGTGVDLASNAKVKFLGEAPLVIEDSDSGSVVLSSGSDNGVLLEVPLGTSTSPRYRVSVGLGFTRRSLDFDPLIYLSDGDRTVGVRVMEADTGSASAFLGSQYANEDRPVSSTARPLFKRARLPEVGVPGRVQVNFTVRGDTVSVTAAMNESAGSQKFQVDLDRERGLVLQIGRGVNTLDGFQLDSMTAVLSEMPCSSTDLATPFGVLTVEDVHVFMRRFNNVERSADLTGEGAVNLLDVLEFLSRHRLGCNG